MNTAMNLNLQHEVENFLTIGVTVILNQLVLSK